MDEDKEFLKAKDYAYRLLSYRQRSVKEITERLKKRGFASRIIRKTIEYLSQLNYLNDEEFARLWIRSKMQSRPSGLALLRYQLRQKGITQELLDKLFSEYAGQYDEYQAAKRLAVSRCRRYRGRSSLKIKRRLYDFLRRRGFSQEAIWQALEQERSREKSIDY